MAARNVLVCCDTFKGTLSAADVGAAICDSLPVSWRSSARNIPLTDGGAGFLDAVAAAVNGSQHEASGGGAPLQRLTAMVVGPLGIAAPPVVAAFGVHAAAGYAIVEMARAAGLPLADAATAPGCRDPTRTTTYGVGQLLCAAAAVPGVHTVYVGCGGSATNDGGLPALQAMGLLRARLRPSPEPTAANTAPDGWVGRAGPPLTGGDLCRLEEMALPDSPDGDDASSSSDPAPAPGAVALHSIPPHPLWPTADHAPRLVLVSDCTNPYTGPEGATAVYGPQKGATDPALRSALEVGMCRAAALVEARRPGSQLATRRGGGAAGGLSGALAAVAGAEWTPGAAVFGKMVGLDEHVAWADLVITGEGAYDSQTLLHGKTLSVVAERCRAHGKPVVVVCGQDLRPPPSHCAGSDAASNTLVLPLVPRHELRTAMEQPTECVRRVVGESAGLLEGLASGAALAT